MTPVSVNSINDYGWQTTDRTSHYIKAGDEKTLCNRHKRFTLIKIESDPRMPICKFCLKKINKEAEDGESNKNTIPSG